MKLIEIVNANIAADEMGKKIWPYDMALALVKVKRATLPDATFFVEKERELVLEYAALDEHGNVRLTPDGRFALKDISKGAEYERRRKELADTEAGRAPELMRVKAPKEIAPAHIEALEGFIEFITEEA